MADVPEDKEETGGGPGGPRPRDRIFAVHPGQALRRLPDGSYVIVPAQPGEPPGTGSRGRTTAPAASAMSSLGRPAMPRDDVHDDLVLTPGGYRPRSMVHPIEPGTVLDGSGGRLRKLDSSGRVLAELGEMPLAQGVRPLMPLHVRREGDTAAPPPALGTGWITYASWINGTGTPISQFTTIWEVPPDPTTHNGQLIYLFSGMQAASFIFQPVLQWGTSAAGGGNFWSVATWYVGPPGGIAAHTASSVRVNPGDALIGVMTLADRSEAGFSYDGGFFFIADSGWSIQNMPELTMLFETLEAYNVQQCTDYPPVSRTTLAGIDIKQGSARPAVTWTANNAVADCGQHTIIHSNSASGGSVD